ncbi:MAG: M43 family zinc metalloprotease [Salinivirgaceae bacterium]
MKKNILLLFILSIVFGLKAQPIHKCAINYFDSIEVVRNPEILKRRVELEAFTQDFIKSKYQSTDTLIIPVVFHVLHQYGSEKISIEKIQWGIDQMNVDYRADNTELNSVVNDFIPIIGNPSIEFRLAKLTPDGTCTSGVVYYETELTYNASNTLKYTIKSWDPQSYLNIWTVSSIEGNAAAWSHYPGVDPALDGVVSIYTYVSSGHVLSHEVGHYLNLAHPWGSTNEPGLESNCSIDDNVEDTPNTIGVDQHCNLGMVSCGFLTNVQNFMDYSTCEAMFTQGQVDRMRAALNSGISGRKYLWTPENLSQTGTSNDYIDPGCPPIADIESDIYPICPGTSYQFTDFSSGDEITEWNWTFEGGEPSVSTVSSPEITYYQPGLYPVSLTVVNGLGSNTITRENLIFVPDTLSGIIAPTVIDMEEADFPNYVNDLFKSWEFEEAGNAHWEKFSNVNTSLRIKNQSNEVGTINSVITSNINLNPVANPDYIYFDMAYAQKNSESMDELKVFVSPDCGKKWIVKYIKSGKSLVTNGGTYITSSFEPSATQWRTEKIDIKNYKNNNHLRVKFQIKSNGGNYLYIDNVNIGGEPLVGIEEHNRGNLSVYPNPMKNNLTINFTMQKSGKTTIKLYNIYGCEIYSQQFEGIAGSNIKELTFDQPLINTGVYFLSVINNEMQRTKRLIINN